MPDQFCRDDKRLPCCASRKRFSRRSRENRARLEGHGAVFECGRRLDLCGDGRGFRGLSQGYRLRPAPGQARGDLGCDRLDLGRPLRPRRPARRSIEIPRAIRREVYIRPWSDFPPSLKADVDAFLLRLSGADLSEDGPARPARPATLKTREKQLRLAASALFHKGVGVEAISSLADLVAFERFKLILRFLLDRHDNQTSPQIAQIAAFLKGVARHWARADDLTLLQMQKVASRLSTGRRGLTAKNRERLRPFDDTQTVALFLCLPRRIRHEVEKDPRAKERKAVAAQMAAAIAILQGSGSPQDRQSCQDRHAQRSDCAWQAGLPRRPRGSAQNGEPIDFELPAEVVEIVGWYVREYRPHLLRAPTDALFPEKRADRNRRRNSVRRSKPQAFDSPASLSIPTSSATPARRSSSTSGRASTRSSDRFSAIVRSRRRRVSTREPRRARPDSTMRQSSIGCEQIQIRHRLAEPGGQQYALARRN